MPTTLGTFMCKKLAAFATVFVLAIPGCTQATEKILYSFTGSTDGGFPQSGLTLDGKGNLFGTTSEGGSGTFCPCGTAFELSPSSNGTWTKQVIHSFGSTSTDGTTPSTALIFDPKGNLYGMTLFGGASFQGTVYELSPGANSTWTETILYNFTGGVDGNSINGSRLAIDSVGNLFGMTNGGGTYGFGVVFELVSGANGTWTQKVLHSFRGDDDGYEAYESSVVLDGAGGLYGITRNGGAHDYGVVFGLRPQPDGSWSERVIYSFTGVDGESIPTGGLLLDSRGNLYGAAYDVFELIPGVNGAYTHKTLHTYTGSPDGAFPQAPPISDVSGNLFGTTYTGGDHYGTVYELKPGSGGNWNERVLHRFSASGGDGTFPTIGPLVMDTSGNLYGTTQSGGGANAGVVFEVTP